MIRDLFGKTPCVILALVAALAGSGSALAQDYPNKPIRIIVGQAAGGASDVLARTLGSKLGDSLGQQVLVDNRAGANGIIAAEAVAKAAPDGYTLLMGSSPILAINPALYKKLPYDPIADFTPIALFGKAFYALLVPSSSPANSVKDLIALAKAKPGQLNYGAGSSGARANIEIFNSAAGIKLTHVAYKSNTQALTDLLGGRLDMLFETTVTSAPHIKAGKVKALAVTSAERLSQFPELPTVSESGVPGYEYTAWVSVHAPAGLAPGIQQRLSAEIMKVMSMPEVIERFRNLGFEPRFGNVEQVTTLLKSDIVSYKKAVKDAGIPQE